MPRVCALKILNGSPYLGTTLVTRSHDSSRVVRARHRVRPFPSFLLMVLPCSEGAAKALHDKSVGLKLGDRFPDFEADTSTGRIKWHEYIEGSWAILFSHPADFTPVCTTELGSVAKFAEDFAKKGVKAAKDKFPKGFKTVDLPSGKSYLRTTPQLNFHELNVPSEWSRMADGCSEQLAVEARVAAERLGVVASGGPMRARGAEATGGGSGAGGRRGAAVKNKVLLPRAATRCAQVQGPARRAAGKRRAVAGLVVVVGVTERGLEHLDEGLAMKRTELALRVEQLQLALERADLDVFQRAPDHSGGGPAAKVVAC
ncbi:unnamed protein product [Closterium sp. NIES-53]